MYQKLPSYERPEDYADLPKETQHEWDIFHRGYELVHTMLNECAKDMLAVGIPIQNDKIVDCGLTRTPHNTSALCYFEHTKDGLRFIICIDYKIVHYLDNAEVMANVKNSIYHELLHTIQGADTHNAIFQKWGKFCDAKLGTHTMRSMSDVVFYRTTKRKIYTYLCPRCGFSCLSTNAKDVPICDGCGREMKHQTCSII